MKQPLIPRKIHTFWFGGSEKSELIRHCMDSWRKYAPDFEIIEWDESNCDPNENNYVSGAYKAGKWAFVSDYFRLKRVYEQGGVYMDTDVELLREIDGLLPAEAFFAYENTEYVNMAIFGAVPGSGIIKKFLDSYENDDFTGECGEITIPKRVTAILKSDYGLIPDGKFYESGGIKLYPPNMLTINVFDGKAIAAHHFEASWMEDGSRSPWAYEVLKDYFRDVLDADGAAFSFIRRIKKRIKRFPRIYKFMKKFYNVILRRGS